MEVCHFECGLGNQMLDYCDYLAVKKSNPDKECYAETIIFDIPECSSVISAWNGFELGSVFGIKLPNIKEQFSADEWAAILKDVTVSEFWKHEWSYPEVIVHALAKQGLVLINHCNSLYHDNRIRRVFNFMKKTHLWSELLIRKIDMTYRPKPEELYLKTEHNIYFGHTLMFMYKGNNIEAIEHEIRKTFIFPVFTDEINLKASIEINECNSIGIHIRRDDAMIGVNRSVFYTGYYKKAVRLMKSKVANPVFYIFGTPKALQWTKEHIEELGLTLNIDTVFYVDWNSGTDSYKDMQLLSLCKHNIISLSSFAWWGAFLNKNPNKITISPLKKMNTTHHV